MTPSGDASGPPEGFVLAGGASSRMGREKSRVTLAGEPLLTRALGILREAGLTAAIAGSRPELGSPEPGTSEPDRSGPDKPIRVVEDEAPGRGPLAGICAALAACESEIAVFVPVDLPLLPADLIRYMLQHQQVTGAAVTLAAMGGFTQTFPAVLHRNTLPALRQALGSGRAGCFSAFQSAASALGERVSALPVEVLRQCGHVEHPQGFAPASWFLNVNTQDDLARAEALLAAKDRVS